MKRFGPLLARGLALASVLCGATSAALAAPEISGTGITLFNPAGGVEIRVGGSGFSQTGTTQLLIGSTPASNIQVINGGYGVGIYVRGTAPALPEGVYDVTVINPDNSSDTLEDAITYTRTPDPRVFNPLNWIVLGNQEGLLEGEGFSPLGTTTVTFDGVAASGVQVQPTGRGVACVIPPGEPGPATIRIANPNHDPVEFIGFNYYTTEPEIEEIIPAAGSSGGGEMVRLRGENFLFNEVLPEVYFGGVRATTIRLEVLPYFHVLATTPAHAPGTVDVRVVNADGGEFTLEDGFTFSGPFNNTITTSVNPDFIEAGSSLTLTAPNGFNYQWFKDGVPLEEDEPRLTGTTAQRLFFDPVEGDDEGIYTCQYDNGSNAKVMATTDPILLLVLAPGSVPVAQPWSLAALAVTLAFALAISRRLLRA